VIQSTSRRFSPPWLLVVGVAAVGVYLIARNAPDTTSIGRVAREFDASLMAIPVRIEQLRDEARDRLAAAKAAFREARAESERALIVQLSESKVRGSLPPL
jgi:HAMP domain-containing protein